MKEGKQQTSAHSVIKLICLCFLMCKVAFPFSELALLTVGGWSY